jgi:hypothetical protein
MVDSLATLIETGKSFRICKDKKAIVCGSREFTKDSATCTSFLKENCSGAQFYQNLLSDIPIDKK